MRVILALAALPLVVFALAPRVPVRTSAPLARTPVVSEGVGVIPLDARSFDARWWPDQAPTAIRVKTMPVRVLTDEKPGEPVAEPAETTAALPPPVHAMKRAALRSHADTCARHGMRKVDVVRGKWKVWRCRRG